MHDSTITLVLSILSLIIAVLSLVVSFWVAARDRYRLDVYGYYLDSYEHMSDGIYLRIANTGRRPVTLRCVAVTLRSGERPELPIHAEHSGRFPRLVESELYEFQYNSKNTQFTEIPWAQVVQVAVVDSRNKSHEASGLAEILAQNAHHLHMAD